MKKFIKEWGPDLLVVLACILILAWAVWMDNRRAEQSRNSLKPVEITRCPVEVLRKLQETNDIVSKTRELCESTHA